MLTEAAEVRQWVFNHSEDIFTSKDILIAFPNFGRGSINSTLLKLVRFGALKIEGFVPGVLNKRLYCYKVINKNKVKKPYKGRVVTYTPNERLVNLEKVGKKQLESNFANGVDKTLPAQLDVVDELLRLGLAFEAGEDISLSLAKLLVRMEELKMGVV